MSEKNFQWLELLAHSKNIALGVVVIISLVGAIYGSFKPETEARQGFNTLAPEVTDVAELADENALVIDELHEKIVRLEAQVEVMLHRGSCSGSGKVMPKLPPPPEEPKAPPRNKIRGHVKPKEREIIPPWEQDKQRIK